MTRTFVKYLAPVSALQVALLILSVFWCGESDCLQAGNRTQCSFLVCELLSKDSVPAHECSLNTSTTCSCICHLNALPTDVTLTSLVEVFTPLSTLRQYELMGLPAEPIIRPPVAA